ncbi:MAG TPA: hypothetical protein VLB80_00385 [Candidatus Babeliales bacterium]|nr:hypothetical protein [Candidatus Babeliales bacterium]
MKQLSLIIACIIIQSIPSFAAQHMPGVQTCIGTPELKHWFGQLQLAEYNKEQEQLRKNSRDNSKISQNELDQWMAAKKLEIQKNIRAQKNKQWYDEESLYTGYRRSGHKSFLDLSYDNSFSQAPRQPVEDDKHVKLSPNKFNRLVIELHRNKYNSEMKTIACYLPQLLIEWHDKSLNS